VEAGHSWFNRFRRLLVRWEKKAANYLAFVQLAATLIIYRKLRYARTLSGKGLNLRTPVGLAGSASHLLRCDARSGGLSAHDLDRGGAGRGGGWSPASLTSSSEGSPTRAVQGSPDGHRPPAPSRPLGHGALPPDAEGLLQERLGGRGSRPGDDLDDRARVLRLGRLPDQSLREVGARGDPPE